MVGLVLKIYPIFATVGRYAKLRTIDHRCQISFVRVSFGPDHNVKTYCCGLTVGSALERISIDLALPGGVSFLRADGVSPA